MSQLREYFPIWVVGSGRMAEAYAEVLKARGDRFLVLGRGEASARRFEDATGISVVLGEGKKTISRTPPRYAIVAVGVNDLVQATREMVRLGVKKVLVEKPGAMTSGQLCDLALAAEGVGAEIFIAYNRRFYASVREARRLISVDGGVSSMSFDFTEWSSRIADGNWPERVKDRWLICNSSHVIDTAFFLAGWPSESFCWTAGSLSWHGSASRFVGAGTTQSSALFSYSADWTSAGRWGIELRTAHRKIVLCPMEKLSLQEKGVVTPSPVEIDDKYDRYFKPGIYLQVDSFLGGQSKDMCTVRDQIRNIEFYQKMAGYPLE